MYLFILQDASILGAKNIVQSKFIILLNEYKNISENL